MTRIPWWRPFARREQRARIQRQAEIRRGIELQEFLWELSGHGKHPISLGTITRDGYSGMDPALRRFLDRHEAGA